MKAVVQRVTKGSVRITELNYYQEIQKGMVILLGVKETDTIEDVNFVADKCCNLRIFDDSNGKMNLSIRDIDGELLIISQFTLYGDAQKGNRPSFSSAAKPDKAKLFYESFVDRCKKNLDQNKIKTGVFAEMMHVEIHNDGPVTIIVTSKNEK